MGPAREPRKWNAVHGLWLRGLTLTVIGAVFAVDLATRPGNVSPTFAYTLPIFLSLFDPKPKPFAFAALTAALSVVGAAPHGDAGIPGAEDVLNRVIAVATQGAAAYLVHLQAAVRTNMQRDLDRQTRFVDILAHEIRNALTAVNGHAQRLAQLSDRLGPGDVTARAGKIRAAADRIEAILERVQFASALGNGIVPMNSELIDINALVENLVAHLREEAAETAIEFSRSAERAHVWGDAVLVRHAIENVLRNGVQYSPTNDVVSVLIDVQQSQVRIGVQDTGPGIPAEEIARVREPYFRGAASRGTSGTGLGLYFVDRIVKGHGGALYIDSKAGRGASVTIELPLSKTPAPP